MPVRPAVVAGQFYPADPAGLRQEIEAFFHKAALGAESHEDTAKLSAAWSWERPLLTMLPHAGHVYCGGVIAAGLAGIRLARRLVILAPSHTGQGHPLGFWPDGAWETPLGAVPVDGELARELAGLGGGFAPDVRPHLREHDIEVLLPFLQTVRPDLSILPVVVGGPDGLAEAGHVLARLIAAHAEDGDAGEAAIILSSDMNHYAPEAENRSLDGMALDALLSLDPQRLLEVVQGKRISMCGILPALMGLLACRELGAAHARLAGYDTSASASGGASRVVGYAAVRVW